VRKRWIVARETVVVQHLAKSSSSQGCSDCERGLIALFGVSLSDHATTLLLGNFAEVYLRR